MLQDRVLNPLRKPRLQDELLDKLEVHLVQCRVVVGASNVQGCLYYLTLIPETVVVDSIRLSTRQI